MEIKNESFISKYRVFILFVVLMIASAAILMLKPSEGTTYTAVAQGYNGDVKVQVVINDENIIKSVTVLEHSETDGIGTVAVDEVPAQIVAANGIEVDGVSSASYTTKAIKEAVADCMEQAGLEVTWP